MQQSELKGNILCLDRTYEEITRELYDPRKRGILVLDNVLNPWFAQALIDELGTLPYQEYSTNGAVDEHFRIAKFGAETFGEALGITIQPLEAIERYSLLHQVFLAYQHFYDMMRTSGSFSNHEINSVTINNYPVGTGRIGPHQDFSTDKNLVGILNVCGRAELHSGIGRQHKTLVRPVIHHNPPGSATLIRAPRNANEKKIRPWHEVLNTTEDRTAIILRATE